MQMKPSSTQKAYGNLRIESEAQESLEERMIARHSKIKELKNKKKSII